MQANGRLQRWNSRGSRPQGLVQRPAEQFKHLKGAMQATLTATGLGEALDNVKAKRPQAWVEALDNVKAMAVTKQVPHLRWRVLGVLGVLGVLSV